MMRRLSFLLSLLVLTGAMPSVLGAVTAKWLVEPVYDVARPLGEGMFLLKQRGKVGVIDGDGQWIIPMEVDSVTNFTEGLALIMVRTGDGMRIKSILRSDRSVIPMHEEYIASAYPFFSEGLLPVYKKGKGGYIDSDGFEIVPFKFTNLHPFSEELAAVSKGKDLFSKGKALVGVDGAGKDKVFYVNRQGKELKLAKNIGDIYFGSTFKDGEALVINKKNNYIIINSVGGVVRTIKATPMSLDERGAILSGWSKKNVKRTGLDNNITIFSSGQLYGYRQGDQVVLPPQFTGAEPFYDGYAAVDRFHKWGILKLIDGVVKVNITPSNNKSDKEGYELFNVRVSLPNNYGTGSLRLSLRDENTSIEEVVAEGKNGIFDFVLPVPSDREKLKRIDVLSGNLTLWSEEITHLPQLSGRARSGDISCVFSPKEKKIKANAKDNGYATIAIRNNSSHIIKAPLTVKGAYCKTKTINIGPGKTVSVSLGFSKILKKEERRVTVTAGDVVIFSDKIILSPFFDDFK